MKQHGFGKAKMPKIIVSAVLAAALCCTALPAGAFAQTARSADWSQHVLNFDGESAAMHGWQYYFYDTDFLYESGGAYVDVTENGRNGGNALHVRREDNAPPQIVLYSYHAEAEANTLYHLEAYVKTEGTADSSVGFTRNEIDAKGAETFPGYTQEKAIAGDTGGEWQKISLNFTTAANTAEVGAKIMINRGIGDFYIDDVTISKVLTEVELQEDYPWQYYGWGVGVDDWGVEGQNALQKQKWTQMTEANISREDSSDGDYACLNLRANTSAKTKFGALPRRSEDTVYRLSFKYKGGAADGSVDIRMDGYTLGGTQFYWLQGSDAAQGIAADWTEYSYDFKVGEGQEIVFVTLVARNADYLIDEVEITCLDEDDPMQYVIGGSFGNNVALDENVQLVETAMLAKQPDGSYVYAAGNQTPEGIGTAGEGLVGYGRGRVNINTSALPKDQKYKVSYEYRGGIWATTIAQTPTAEAIYGADIMEYFENTGRADPKNNGWSSISSEFVALGDFVNIYGDATNTEVGATQTYIRNIKIVGEDGEDYSPAAPVGTEVEVPELEYGENIFPYGTMEGTAENDTEWTLSGGARITGFTFEDGNEGYYLAFRGKGTAESPAEEIEAAAKDTFVKVYCRYSSEGDLTFKLKTNDGTVLEALDTLDSETVLGKTVAVYGQYALPEGTTSVSLVVENESGYAAVADVGFRTHAHAFVADDDKDHPAIEETATCKKEGYVQKYCADCGEYVTVEYTPKSEHRWGEWTVEEAASCIVSGVQVRECLDCGTKESEVIPAAGHHFENGVCTVCGAADPDRDPGADPVPPEDKGCSCKGAVAAVPLAALPALAAAAIVMLARRKKN